MNREEAIKLLEHISIAYTPTDAYGDYDDPQPYEEAIDMAIEALSAEAVSREHHNMEIKELKHQIKDQADMVSVVRCKDCKHFELDHFDMVNGIPIITAHEICTRWCDGAKTDKDGFCFMAERREEVNGFKSVGQAWNTSQERWET